MLDAYLYLFFIGLRKLFNLEIAVALIYYLVFNRKAFSIRLYLKCLKLIFKINNDYEAAKMARLTSSLFR